MRSPLSSYGELQLLKLEVNRLIDRLVKGAPVASTDWQPPADILECGRALVIQIGVPGLSREDLEVRVDPGRLEVRGRKNRLASEPHARRFHLMERFMGQFQLTIDLPAAVLADGVRARLANGVLTVTLPRRKEQPSEPRTVPVHEEEND